MAIEEAESSNSEAKRREKEAHILNIHEDVVLSKAICYFFPRDEVTTFGNRNRSDATPPCGRRTGKNMRLRCAMSLLGICLFYCANVTGFVANFPLFAAPGVRRFAWEGQASGQITAS